MIEILGFLITSTAALAQESAFSPPQLTVSALNGSRYPSKRKTCPKETCSSRKEVEVCFMGYEPKYSEELKQLAYHKTCGWDAISFQTRTPQELSAAMAELGKSCVSIRKFTVASHGAPGALYLFDQKVAPPITVKNMKEELGQIGCWTLPGSEIVASGCNVGATCAGDNFLFQAATQMLPQGGKVRGSTALSGTFLPGLVPVMSSDLNKAQITYDPLKNPRYTWQNRGEILGTETPREVTNQSCLDDIHATARALGPSAAESAICSSVPEHQRLGNEINDVAAQIGRLPSNRFSAPGFEPLATRFQDIQGSMYAGSICDRGNTLGIQLPPPIRRAGGR